MELIEKEAEELKNREIIKELLNGITKPDLLKLTDELNIYWRNKKGTKKPDLIDILIKRIERKELNEDNLKDAINKIIIDKPKKVKIAIQKPRIDANELMDNIISINNKIELIDKQIRHDGEKIDSMESKILEITNLVSAKLNNLDKLKTSSVESLLKELHKEKLHYDFADPSCFDRIRANLLTKGFDDINILKNGMLFIILNELSQSIKNLKWPEDIELFYKNIQNEFYKNPKKSDALPIYEIRNAVCNNMGISKESFDRQLAKCFKEGWVLLELGSPIGEENVERLTLGDKNYYYLRLKRIT